MGGLLVVVLLTLYVALGVWLLIKIRAWWAKVAVVVTLALIPTADAVYGRMKLKEIAKDGGTKIYRTVEGVEGFYLKGLRPFDFWIKQRGFRFAEGDGDGLKPERLSLGPDGKIIREENVKLRSRYVAYQEHGDSGSLYRFSRDVVKHMQDDEVLGTDTNFGFKGGWVERAIAGLYGDSGNAGSCRSRDAGQGIKDLTAAVLKPTK